MRTPASLSMWWAFLLHLYAAICEWQIGGFAEHGHHALVPLPLLPISFAAFICGHHRSIPEVVRGPAYAKVPRARGVGPDADARPA